MPTAPASMETAQTTTEELIYANLNTTRTDKPSGYPNDTYTNPNEKVARVKAAAGSQQIGPAITLRVMCGDKFNLRVSSWYKTNGVSPGTPVNPLTDLLSALINGVSAASNTGNHSITVLELQNSGVLTPSAQQFLTNQGGNTNSSKPQAFVNWILFDEQFKYVESSSGFEQVGNNEEFKTVVKTDLPINKNGYLYVYVTNATPNIEVFFDNLQVTHNRGVILEETHYYPFGLILAGISSKAASSLENKKKYNGIDWENDFDLNIYDAFFRELDPQTGRFWQVDPEPKYEESPYVSMGNNPITNIDPLGNDFWDIIAATVISAIDNTIPGSNLREKYIPRNAEDFNNALRAADYTMLSVGAATMINGASTTTIGLIATPAEGVGVPVAVVGVAEFITGAIITVRSINNISKGYNYGKKDTDPLNVHDEDKIPRDQLDPPNKPGSAPKDKKTGEPIELHHIDQKPNGRVKEMRQKDHRGKGNDTKNHPDKNKPSKIDRKKFNKQRRDYWKKEFFELPKSNVNITPKG